MQAIIRKKSSSAGGDYNVLLNTIGSTIEIARQNAVRAVNSELVKANWEIGRHIIQFEQHGNERAEYGSDLLSRLSKDLKLRYGKGFGRRNVLDMRRFYLTYQNWQAVPAKLSWTHYTILLSVTNESAHQFNSNKSIVENWSKRELERQIDSALFERLVLSKRTKRCNELPRDGGFGAHSTHASPQPLSRGEGQILVGVQPGSQGEGRYYVRNQPGSQGEGNDPGENFDGLVVAEMRQPYKTANKELWSILKDRAREHRKEPTDAEATLWEAIRGSKLGHKIRRQHPIEVFIADFICIRKGVIIEVDGGYHLTPEQRVYDEQRTFVLEQAGFNVVRFTNEQVLNNISAIVAQIKYRLDSAPDVPPYSSGYTSHVINK